MLSTTVSAENCIYFCTVHFSMLVHSDEEIDVLQHACADGSEETERDVPQFDREKESHARDP